MPLSKNIDIYKVKRVQHWNVNIAYIQDQKLDCGGDGGLNLFHQTEQTSNRLPGYQA